MTNTSRFQNWVAGLTLGFAIVAGVATPSARAQVTISDPETHAGKKTFVMTIEQQVAPFAWEKVSEFPVELEQGVARRIKIHFKKQGIDYSYLLSYGFDWAVFWTRDADQTTGFFRRDEKTAVGDDWTGEITENTWWETQIFAIRMHLKEALPAKP